MANSFILMYLYSVNPWLKALAPQVSTQKQKWWHVHFSGSIVFFLVSCMHSNFFWKSICGLFVLRNNYNPFDVYMAQADSTIIFLFKYDSLIYNLKSTVYDFDI